MSAEKNGTETICPHTRQNCECVYGPVLTRVNLEINGRHGHMISEACGKIIASQNVQRRYLRLTETGEDQ